MFGQKGVFIAFEGGEFTGKTTQISRLADTLTKKEYTVVVTKEPGGTAAGKQIKKHILAGNLSPEEELRLFMDDRKLHVDQVIVPSLERGLIVLSDRFADSTIAYQHYGRGISRAMIEKENEKATSGLAPHLVVVIDMPPERAFLRAKGRGEKLTTYELENKEFHNRVREGFLQLAKSVPSRYVVIHGDQDFTKVADDIWRAVHERLGL